MIKKILTILPCDHFYGGAEKNLTHILTGYQNIGYEVFVVVWYIDNKRTNMWQNTYKDFKYYTVDKKGILGLCSLIRVLYKISHDNIINTTLISNITLASIVGFIRNLHLYKTNLFIVRDPSSPFLRYSSLLRLLSYKLRYLLGYGAVDYLIFQTSRIKEAFYINTPFNTPCKVIGNPIKLEEIRSKALEYIPNIIEPYILACGRLIPEKGFDLLIDAFNKLNLGYHYKLIILGDGPLREELNTQIKDLNLSNRISLMGFVENPMPYFKNAELCVISSRAEGFPNVLYQMMALNSKILMTKCCGDLDDIPAVHFIEANSIAALELGLKEILKRDYKPLDESLKESFLQSKSIENYMDKFFKITESGKH